MEYSDVVKHLAPCGLNCIRCADYEHGDIKQLSTKLLQALGNYKFVARLKSERRAEFEHYTHFEDILNYFSGASCSGCRGGNVECPLVCLARICHKEKSVDFCFQCPEYPCENQFSGRLRERWQQINDRMKEIGVIEYYYEQARLPRY